MNRIETQGVPATHRVDYWRTEMGRAVGLDFEIDFKSTEAFDMHSVNYSLGALTLGEIWGVGHGVSAQDHQNNRADTCFVVVPRVSNGHIHYGGSKFRLVVNQAYLLGGWGGWSLIEDQRFRHLVLSVPRAAVQSPTIDGTATPFIRPLTATATLVELMKSLVESHLNIDLLADSIRDSMADTLCGLLNTALHSFETPVYRDDHADSRKQHQIRRVREYILDHLDDPSLGAESIASAIGVSSRHLYRLFANEAQALGDLIRAERLDRCRAVLGAPGCSLSISTVAYAWGFNDAAHFSRAFRRRFGMTPREARFGKKQPNSFRPGMVGSLDESVQAVTAPMFARRE